MSRRLWTRRVAGAVAAGLTVAGAVGVTTTAPARADVASAGVPDPCGATYSTSFPRTWYYHHCGPQPAIVTVWYGPVPQDRCIEPGRVVELGGPPITGAWSDGRPC